MRVLLTLYFLCGCFGSLFAQKEANIWYFGQRAGLDFNTNCQPTALFDGQSTYEGCASISDAKTGQLLFYTDGYTAWNREQRVLQNGLFTPYAGTPSVTQGSLIIPVPGDSLSYYWFRMTETNGTLTSPANYTRLSYFLVDMRLDSGLGGLVKTGQDSTLSEGLSGKLTAIRHANKRDYWVLTHQWNNNAFLVYPVTPSGIGRADTIRIGSAYVRQDILGFLKASPDGTKLASSFLSTFARPFDLFDFDPATGKITNYVSLGNVRLQYGLSFSPDNSKLYVTNQTIIDAELNTELIRQYDLKAGDTEAIIKSGKSIIYQNPATSIPYNRQAARNGFYAPPMQIGPDGRIYVAADYSNAPCPNCTRHLIVINKPNEPGFACDVQLQAAELGAGLVGDVISLPNFMQHYFNGLEPKDCPFDRNDECTDANVQIFPNPVKDRLEILITDICFTPYTLRIIDAAGRALATYKVNTPRSQSLDIGTLSGGIYFAELRFSDRTTVKRFLKQ